MDTWRPDREPTDVSEGRASDRADRLEPDAALVAARIGQVRARIAAAESAAGRPVGQVRLLLATKTQPARVVRAAVLADAAARDAGAPGGPALVGENRVQELVAKGPVLAELGVPAHLIGPLQRNKVVQAVRWAACVQTVDSLALAERLAARTTTHPLAVMVQVNVSGEATKHGVPPAEAVDLACAVAALPGLDLRGLMTIGAHSDDRRTVRTGFALLRRLRDAVRDSGGPGTDRADQLSMGMSADLEDAVAEGATLVRVGSAVFGRRS